jgi:hypothetical protein
LTKKNYFNLPRYKLCYTSHPGGTAHGSTAILTKERVEQYKLLKYEEDSIQATSIKVKGFPYEITITAVYCPSRQNLKKEHFETFFQRLGPKFIARGDYKSKHTLWGSRLTTTKVIDLSKIIQEKNSSFLSTGTPTYWPTDGNKISDLLNVFVTNGIFSTCTNIQSSYRLNSDHSPIMVTLSTSVIVRKPTPRLHNSKANWDTYRQIIQDEVNLSLKLKEHEVIELETNNLLSLLQHSAKEATSNNDPKRTANNIPYEIKNLLAEKRRSRSIWQRTHTADSRRKYNRKSNKLKSELQEIPNKSFAKYVSNIQRQGNSIWKRIKNRGRSKTSPSPIRKHSTPPGPWAKSDKEKAEIFAEHLSEVFSPHNNDQDQEVQQDLAVPIQSQECLKTFTLKEIKD